MTSETLHDLPQHSPCNPPISRNSVTSPKRTSTSTTPPRRSLHPPARHPPRQRVIRLAVLKDALKHRIRSCLEEFGEAKLDLHPATALVEWMEEGMIWRRRGVRLMRGAVSRSDDAEKERSPHTNAGHQHRRVEGTTPPSTCIAKTASPNPPPVGWCIPIRTPADIQNFTPPNASFPPTAPAHPLPTSPHTTSLFAMLDEFDIQPPFTASDSVSSSSLLPRSTTLPSSGLGRSSGVWQ